MKFIASKVNPFYKELVRLTASSRNRDKAGQTLLDGVHLLSAFLAAGHRPRHLLVDSKGLQNDEVTALLSRLGDVPITQLDEKLFTTLSELKTTTGLLALIDIPDFEITTGNFVLMLEDIQDPGNLGSILRSAAAAGCDAVFMSTGCVDAWSPRVLRAAMGGHFCLAIHERQDLALVAQNFPGMRLATTLQDAQSLYECDLVGHIAFMIGNEGAGLSEGLLGLSSHRITIPMPGAIESLNAAAATAICLFEAVRQRTCLTGV